jgi:hypothetical protein
MTKLRSSGFEITAVHNHLMGETPKVLYMHYMGHGSATQLATSLRAALAVSKTPLKKTRRSRRGTSAPGLGENPSRMWSDAKAHLKVASCRTAFRGATPSRWRE